MAEYTHSRTSRLRRAIAIMAWGCLTLTAIFLWNQRQTGQLHQSAQFNPIMFELVVFVLTAFAAFV